MNLKLNWQEFKNVFIAICHQIRTQINHVYVFVQNAFILHFTVGISFYWIYSIKYNIG